MDSYGTALRAVFICQSCVAFCTFLACLPIEENPLPSVLRYLDSYFIVVNLMNRGSHEEQEEQDRRRRDSRAAVNGNGNRERNGDGNGAA